MWSKRAQVLVTSCLTSGRSPVLNNEPTIPSQSSREPAPSDFSPVSLWWDGIYEASDVAKLKLHKTPNPSAVLVKKKLFSDERGDNAKEGVLESDPLKVDSFAATTSSNRGTVYSDPSHLHVHGDITTNPAPKEIRSSSSHTANEVADSIKQISGPLVNGLTVEAEETLLLCYGVSPVVHSPTIRVQDSCSVSVPPLLEGDEVSKMTDISNAKNKCYPSKLKVMKAKAALNSGLQHTTIPGKLKPARCLKPPCQSQCKRCDAPRLSDDERLDIFKSFWAIGNHASQWKFISTCVTCSVPKRKRTAKASKGEKHFSREYNFEVNGCLRKVCKTMFKNTLAICDSWVDSSLAHSSCGTTIQDQRGKRKTKIQRCLSQAQ